MEHVEFECPDCGTLHYAPTPVACDCRAGCDWGDCDQTASESYVTRYEVRPFCGKHAEWNRNLMTTGRLLS